MTIKLGDRVPEANLGRMGEKGPESIATTDYFAGRRVVLFSVPGAFTPTCSAKHLPGFIEHQQQIRDQGVDAIACMSVNDTFVMHAWGQHASAEGIDMLADGNGEFAEKLGLDLDATAWGMGYRSQRFAMLVDDGVVKELLVEAPGEFRVSSAEHVLQVLGG
jgi:peroxiredoxin